MTLARLSPAQVLMAIPAHALAKVDGEVLTVGISQIYPTWLGIAYDGGALTL